MDFRNDWTRRGWMPRGGAGQDPPPCSNTPCPALPLLGTLLEGTKPRSWAWCPLVPIQLCSSSKKPQNLPRVVEETQTSIYNFLTACTVQSCETPVKFVSPPFPPHDEPGALWGESFLPPMHRQSWRHSWLSTSPFQHLQLPNLPSHPTPSPRLGSIHECSLTSPDFGDKGRQQRKILPWQV